MLASVRSRYTESMFAGTDHELLKTPGGSFAQFDVSQRIVVKRLSNASHYADRHTKLRIVLKMHVDWANLGILNQKMMFQIFRANSKRSQSTKNKRLPPTGRTTTNFQYSINRGRSDILRILDQRASQK
jgi:hypothetical protein